MLDNQEKKEMHKIGEQYDTPVFIDTSDALCELKVFDEEENNYKILKIDTVARCIEAWQMHRASVFRMTMCVIAHRGCTSDSLNLRDYLSLVSPY
jgi:hypothetical protein